MIDYRQKYIDLLKKTADNLCDFCTHNYQKIIDCEKCKCFTEGYTCELNGKEIRWHWTCRDLNIGDCAVLENTPCHGCLNGEEKGKWAAHFDLNESVMEGMEKDEDTKRRCEGTNR